MQAKFGELIQTPQPVLVDFYATWCGPCQTLSPVLQELSSRLGDRVRIIKIDVDKNQTLASMYNVRSVPTLLLFQAGQIKWRGAGVQSASQLEFIIQQHTNHVVD